MKKSEILDGKILNPHKNPPNRRLTRLIDEYVGRIKKLERIPLPDSGDCWYCLFGLQRIKPGAKSIYGQSHLVLHLEEKYIHGSLIANAVIFGGYNPNYLDFFYSTRKPHEIARMVKKYLRYQLGV